jgi:alkanesulfonate monooxygenase SsuD/methylene tetrahydromethanopterin reductase-like flavin-dependent oxidoreductase (luciferase family)
VTQRADHQETEQLMATKRGFGIAGALDHGIVEEVAAAVQQAGFSSLWANDTPGGDGLAALAAAARVTEGIDLGVGVIPVDRTGPEQIAARLVELGLPFERTIVGVGSGGARTGSVEMVREAVTALKRLVPVRVYVGALGPRMVRMGGEVADGLLLNWLTPEEAEQSVQWVREAAAKTGRPAPVVAAYVRVGLEAGQERLQIEADRYAGFPAYAAHFERMGVPAIATTVSGGDVEIERGLAGFDGKVDEVIVRAIAAEETAEAYLELVRASAPPPER